MDDLFAEVRRIVDELIADARDLASVELVGIVDLSGVEANLLGNSQDWTICFILEVWQVGSGAIRTEPLTVWMLVPKDEMERLQNAIEPGMAVRLRSRISEMNSTGAPQALLESFVGVETEAAALREALAQLASAALIETPDFGVFEFDRELDWYSAKVRWGDRDIDLYLDATDPTELEAALITARELWSDAEGWTRKVGDFAVQELLQLKNESWLDGDEDPVSASEFLESMILESITVNSEGGIEFLHDDGDLFWGHAIQVWGNVETGLEGADIPG